MTQEIQALLHLREVLQELNTLSVSQDASDPFRGQLDRLNSIGGEMRFDVREQIMKTKQIFSDPMMYSLLRQRHDMDMEEKKITRAKRGRPMTASLNAGSSANSAAVHGVQREGLSEGRAESESGQRPDNLRRGVGGEENARNDLTEVAGEADENDEWDSELQQPPLPENEWGEVLRRYTRESTSKVPALLMKFSKQGEGQGNSSSDPPEAGNTPSGIHLLSQVSAVEGEEPSRKQSEALTDVERKYLEMIKTLDQSSLQTLKRESRVVLSGRRRLGMNFAPVFKQDVSIQTSDEHVTAPDLVLTVDIDVANRPGTLLQRFEILGEQPLTVLRDAMACVSDFLVSDPHQASINTQRRKVSSSFLCVENVFYNDLRYAQAQDYSKPIIEWLKRESRSVFYGGLAPEARVMGETKFVDLAIRLHYPYVLMHQGECEHIVTFRQVRLLNKQDDQRLKSYPRQLFRCRAFRPKCRQCQIFPANYITVNDIPAGETPTYFCEECYEKFHYGPDGKLLYDHQVFPYAKGME
ncbi:uncharacterized protein VTP21DRAFT_5210 [Calcarisporiella thermophila]|uniref:uncharacterized protein n=1 Tax=Calcarisporiella thermophila TaxID=911321 RepID=UPI00374292BF